MNRTEFMKELEFLLQDIPDEEREDAISYYRDYLEDAGDDREEEAIREFGSPERVAAIIRADISGNLEAGGEFTETGYQDERFRDPRYQVAERKDLPEVAADDGNQNCGNSSRTQGDGRPAGHGAGANVAGIGSRLKAYFNENGNRVIRVLLLLAVLFIAAPLVLGLGGGLLGVLAGIVALIIGSIAAVIGCVILIGVLTICACLGAVVLLILGIGTLPSAAAGGILMIGSGVFVLGLALFGVVLSILIYGKLIPWCIRVLIDGLNRLLHREGRTRS